MEQLASVDQGQFSYALVIRDGWVTDGPPAGRWAVGHAWGGVAVELRRRGARVVMLEQCIYCGRVAYLSGWGCRVCGLMTYEEAAAVSPWARWWQAHLDYLSGGRTGPLITARYHGRCRTCTRPWEPGDSIAFDEDEDGWICEDCSTR